MIMVLIITLPYLSSDPTSSATAPYPAILNMLEVMDGKNKTAVNISSKILISEETNIFFLEINGRVIFDDFDKVGKLREATEVLEEISASGNSTVIINNKPIIVLEAFYHIYLIMFVVALFAIGSFVISRDAFELVVKPIERMTSMIRKLAGTICILSSSGVPEGPLIDVDDHEENETLMLESTVAKLAQIFDVKQDSKSVDAKKKTKAERMLTGIDWLYFLYKYI